MNEQSVTKKRLDEKGDGSVGDRSVEGVPGTLVEISKSPGREDNGLFLLLTPPAGAAFSMNPSGIIIPPRLEGMNSS